MLKRGKEVIETSVKEVFKPIIAPLQEMADRTLTQPNIVKGEFPSIKQELPAEEEEEAPAMRGEDDLMSFHSTSENTFPTLTTSSSILQKKSDNLSKYLKILSDNQNNNPTQTNRLVSLYSFRLQSLKPFFGR